MKDLSLDSVIFAHVKKVLDLYGRNKLRAAARLDISRGMLYRILERMEKRDDHNSKKQDS